MRSGATSFSNTPPEPGPASFSGRSGDPVQGRTGGRWKTSCLMLLLSLPLRRSLRLLLLEGLGGRGLQMAGQGWSLLLELHLGLQGHHLATPGPERQPHQWSLKSRLLPAPAGTLGVMYESRECSGGQACQQVQGCLSWQLEPLPPSLIHTSPAWSPLEGPFLCT